MDVEHNNIIIKPLFDTFSSFQFKPESVFLMKKYNYGALPPEVIRKVFGILCKYEDFHDKKEEKDVDMMEIESDTEARIQNKLKIINTMSAVCKGWYNAMRTTTIWEEIINYELEISAKKTETILKSMENDRNFSEFNSSVKERFFMLRETLKDVQKYLKMQLSDNGWKDVRTPSLSYALLKNLHKNIDSIQATCEAIFSRTCEITCNFDLLELTLRKGLYELRSMVPVEKGTDNWGVKYPSTSRSDPRVNKVIIDPEARNAWKTFIGPNRACVDFGTFMKKLILRNFPCANNEYFAKRLSYHLNFPVSDIVTVYRFRTLISEFGPYTRFAENFDRYAMRPGFVGFMNTVKAEEVLIQYHKQTAPEKRRSVVLIRYSRKQPDVLAFTSLDIKKRKLEHRRNLYRDGTPIPIGIFVEQHYKDFVLLPMSIDDDIITCPNIFNIANISTPHYRYVEDCDEEMDL